MLTWTDDLTKLIKQRRWALKQERLPYSRALDNSLTFLETQLSAPKSKADEVQHRLIRRWWPKILVILPSARGGQSKIREKWIKRYEEAKRNICTPSLFS